MAAAFYIVPAAYERRYVQIGMAVLPEFRVQDNFLFHHTTGPDSALHDQVLHTASLIAVTLCGVALLALWAGSRKQEERPARPVPFLTLLGLTCVVGLVLTPWSRAFWTHAPEVSYLQFPWRATFIVAVTAALGLACLLNRPWLNQHPWRGSVFALVAAIPLAWISYRGLHQRCDPGDSPARRLAIFESSKGFDPTDEYTPTDADNDVLRRDDPPYWMADSPNDPPPASATRLPGGAPTHLEFQSTHATNIVLNLRAYPAWEVLLDGAPDLQRVQRDDGLLAMPIPAGASTVDVRWVRLTDQKLGDLTTLLGIGLLSASMLPARWRSRGHS
jgi:hypothetical protein